jgi:antitoxin PrlF
MGKLEETMQLHYHGNILDARPLVVAMNFVTSSQHRSESTLTDRYQTTVPEAVRQALGLNKRDKIFYTIQSDGRVLLSRGEQAETDPILEKFLEFLAQDMADHPQSIQPIQSDLLQRAQALVAGMDVDLDAPLLDEDE